MVWAQDEWRKTNDSERAGRRLGEVYERYDELAAKHAFTTEEEQKYSISEQAAPTSSASRAAAGTLASNTATLELRLCDSDVNVSASTVSKRLLLTMKVSAVRGLLEKAFKVPPGMRSQYKLMTQETKVKPHCPALSARKQLRMRSLTPHTRLCRCCCVLCWVTGCGLGGVG